MLKVLSTHIQAVGSKSYFSLIPNGPMKDPEPCYDCYSCAIEMTNKVILTLGKITNEKMRTWPGGIFSSSIELTLENHTQPACC